MGGCPFSSRTSTAETRQLRLDDIMLAMQPPDKRWLFAGHFQAEQREIISGGADINDAVRASTIAAIG